MTDGKITPSKTIIRKKKRVSAYGKLVCVCVYMVCGYRMCGFRLY